MKYIKSIPSLLLVALAALSFTSAAHADRICINNWCASSDKVAVSFTNDSHQAVELWMPNQWHRTVHPGETVTPPPLSNINSLKITKVPGQFFGIAHDTHFRNLRCGRNNVGFESVYMDYLLGSDGKWHYKFTYSNKYDNTSDYDCRDY